MSEIRYITTVDPNHGGVTITEMARDRLSPIDRPTGRTAVVPVTESFALTQARVFATELVDSIAVRQAAEEAVLKLEELGYGTDSPEAIGDFLYLGARMDSKFREIHDHVEVVSTAYQLLRDKLNDAREDITLTGDIGDDALSEEG